MKRTVYLLPLLFLALITLPLEAQLSNSLYFMQGVPQANRVNPAYRPDASVYVGIPMFAPVRAEFGSSSLAYEDIIYRHPSDPDSLITFLHPEGSKDAFIKQLSRKNALTSGFSSAILSFGFGTEAGYFSFDLSTRWEGNLLYPGDLFRLLLEGTDAGNSYQLDGMGADVTLFDEIAIGWSYPLMDNLRIGARFKVLTGIANLSTKQSNLNLRIAENTDWILQSDMLFNASLPFAEVVYDDDGMIEDIILDEALENPGFSNIANYALNMQNFGLGLDLGVEYRPFEELQLSISLSDLGYIRWKDETHSIAYSTMQSGDGGRYTFRGLEFDPFSLSDEYSFSDFLDSSLTELADSLSSFLDMRESGPYAKMLNAKLYAGASYQVARGVNFGLLSRTDFLNGKVNQQFTASANFAAGRNLNFSLSYSYMNRYFKNLGAGLAMNFGPLNIYLISDNVLNVVFWPQEARQVNLWFGMNLMFGYREKVDMPLVL